MEIPDGVFAEYEWVEEGKPYREALIPAAWAAGREFMASDLVTA